MIDIDSVGERFGIVVRQLREARGWSQERLAGRAELNRSYFGEIERATAMPSLATAAKLAQALGVPLSELIRAARPARAPGVVRRLRIDSHGLALHGRAEAPAISLSGPSKVAIAG